MVHSNVAAFTGSCRQMLTMLCACCLIMAAMRKAHSTTKLTHVPFVSEHRRDTARDGNDRQLARN